MLLITSIVVGILLGVLNARFLFVGSAVSLILWGFAGLIFGYFAKDKKQALLNGALYGFVLSFAFMLAGYSGTRPIVSVLPFFALLGLFGALCGLILGIVGNLLHKLRK